MAKPELGTKRTDPETGKKFYDLNRDPVVSPYTGKSYPLSHFEAEAASVVGRGGGRSAAPAAKAQPQESEEVVESSDNTVSLSDVADEEEADNAGDSNMPDSDEGDEGASVGSNDSSYIGNDEDEDENNDVSDILGGGPNDEED